MEYKYVINYVKGTNIMDHEEGVTMPIDEIDLPAQVKAKIRQGYQIKGIYKQMHMTEKKLTNIIAKDEDDGN